MKNTYTLLLLFNLSFAISTTSCAQKKYIDKKAFANEIVTEFAKDYPGLSITIIKDTSIVWSKQSGFSDLKNEIKVTPDTKFNIYSTSKLITGLAFLKLASNNGESLLNTFIKQYDSTLPTSYDKIKISHLLNHTSGIRHYRSKKDWITFSNLRCKSPTDAITYFYNDKLKFEPGQKELYSTFGMVMASHILEKITKLDYVKAINSLVPIEESIIIDSETVQKATPYVRKTFSGFKVYEKLSAECKFGGGGLLASSKQLAQFGAKLFDETFILKENLHQLFKNQFSSQESNGIAFGTGSGFSDKYGLYVNIGGASPGGRSYLMVLPDHKLSVALTTNCEGDGDKAYDLCSKLIKKFGDFE